MPKSKKSKTESKPINNNKVTERQDNKNTSTNVQNYVSGDREWSSSSHQFSREPNPQ